MIAAMVRTQIPSKFFDINHSFPPGMFSLHNFLFRTEIALLIITHRKKPIVVRISQMVYIHKPFLHISSADLSSKPFVIVCKQ